MFANVGQARRHWHSPTVTYTLANSRLIALQHSGKAVTDRTAVHNLDTRQRNRVTHFWKGTENLPSDGPGLWPLMPSLKSIICKQKR